MRRGRLVACVCMLGIFAAAVVTSLDYSLGDALGPGPGFFPFWLSLLGAALTVAILVETARSHDVATGSLLPTGRRPGRPAACSSRWQPQPHCSSRLASG